MVSYKELGLVNTREMFAKAIKGGYAVPAFNFNNMEQLQAIVMAAAETKSPVILQVSKGARNYANQTLLRYMAEGAVEYAKELGWAKPQIVLHLDHGDSFELCKSCVDMGFSSVMIDGSSLPYDENVALTKKVVEYAHQFDVTVEGELGVLAGVEDHVFSEASTYTNPLDAVTFFKQTRCDCLAISYGTMHGAVKGKDVKLRKEIATAILAMSVAMETSITQISELNHSVSSARNTADEFGHQLSESASSATQVGEYSAQIGNGVESMETSMNLVATAQRARADASAILHGEAVSVDSLSEMEKRVVEIASTRSWVKGSADREALIDIYDALFASIEQRIN